MTTISEAYATAVEHFRAGDLQEAERICARINRRAPEYPDAWYFRGLISYSLGRPDLAIEYIRRGLVISPDDEEAHNNLGVILCDQGNWDEAIASLQRAVALRPEYAEAHNNLGVALKARGELDQAADCYRSALRLAPGYAEAHANLGGVLAARGRLDEAVASYRRVLEIDPGNSVAEHMLAACTGAGVPDRASDSYVRETFDRFAGSFDQVLTRLEYRAPRLVTAALAAEFPQPTQSLGILDAGCGTGLCGPLLRPYAQRLVGVDLSPAMLEKARRVGAYDELVEAELTAYMNGATAAFDVVVSADTLVYFGALNEVLTATGDALRPDGLLISTFEHAVDGAGDAGFQLQPSGRYKHTQDQIERTLARAGFSLRRIVSDVLRRDRGEPVAGLVVTAIASRRSSTSPVAGQVPLSAGGRARADRARADSRRRQTPPRRS